MQKNDVLNKINKNEKLTSLNDLSGGKTIRINDLNRLLHDAKLPITVLQSISDIMFKLNAQEEMENYIFILDSNIKYLIRILESLKDEIIDIDNKSFELLNTDIIGYTEMIVDSVRPVCEIKNIIVNFECDLEYYEYSMNYRFYERIILNVLKNSIKHAKNCTNIDVKLKFYENKMKIYINDNGENNEPAKIGTTNFGENFIEKSTGEGLYIITSLANELGGNVSYLLLEDGMRFTLELIVKEVNVFGDNLEMVQLEMEEFSCEELN